MNAASILGLCSVSKTYGDFLAVDRVSFDVPQGSLVSLLGPSGSGKTTILRLIAGFDTPTTGDILLMGETINDKPPHAREVTTVFQQYSLFPHMNVYDNLAFGLHCKGISGGQVDENVSDVLNLVKMAGKERRSIRSLSGGEQQRVALARSLVTAPKVLLLDEPLGALDLKLRREMAVELRQLHQRVGMTFLYVTHDQEEALSMSDLVIVMHAGRVHQIGTPSSLYWTPSDTFVADFIGGANILAGRLSGPPRSKTTFHLADSDLMIPCTAPDSLRLTTDLSVAIRPELITLNEAASRCDCSFEGTVADTRFYGSVTEIDVVLKGQKIRVRHTQPRNDDLNRFAIGSQVRLGWNAADAILVASSE